MSEQIRPDGVRFARALLICLALSLVAVGLLFTLFSLVVNGWWVLAAVGVVILWLCRDREPKRDRAVSDYFEGEWVDDRQ